MEYKSEWKEKIEVKQLISDKIMDKVKNFENKIQNKPASMDDEGKNREILMVDDNFII